VVALTVAALVMGRDGFEGLAGSHSSDGVYGLMVVVAVGSLAIYGEVAFGPPRPQPAFWFLVVPAASGYLVQSLSRSRCRCPRDRHAGVSDPLTVVHYLIVLLL